MATVDRVNNISVMYIRNFLAMYDNLDAECLDVGTLCTKANNQWAKWKPVRFPQMDVTAYPNWYRAFDGSCGLDIKTYTTMSAMFTALRAGTYGWSYIKPNGGDSSPYRLLDFMNYSTTAQPPLFSNTLAAKYYKTNSTVGASATVNTPDSTELSLADIGNAVNLANCYFGAGISKVGTTTYQYITETSTITGGGGGGVEIPISGLTIGNYHITFFLSTVAHGTLTSVDDGTYVPIPFLPIQTIEIKENPATIDLVASWNSNVTTYYLILTNESSSIINLSSCSLYIRYMYKSDGTTLQQYTDTQETGESLINIGSISVPANGTYSYPVTPPATQSSSLPNFLTRGGRIWFRNGTSNAYYADTEFYEEA